MSGTLPPTLHKVFLHLLIVTTWPFAIVLSDLPLPLVMHCANLNSYTRIGPQYARKDKSCFSYTSNWEKFNRLSTKKPTFLCASTSNHWTALNFTDVNSIFLLFCMIDKSFWISARACFATVFSLQSRGRVALHYLISAPNQPCSCSDFTSTMWAWKYIYWRFCSRIAKSYHKLKKLYQLWHEPRWVIQAVNSYLYWAENLRNDALSESHFFCWYFLKCISISKINSISHSSF